MKRKQRVLFLFLLCLFSITFLGACQEDGGDMGKEKLAMDYYSPSIYVYNLIEEKEVLSIHADERRAQASLTKIMTVYLALEHLEDLSMIAPVDYETRALLYEQDASMAGFYAHETTSYRDLLYGAILPSGGECAASLAVNLSGNIQTFVDEMNRKAEELGLENTRYETVTGMDRQGQYSTARDTAKLLSYALQDGDFRVIFTSPFYQSSPSVDHPEGIGMESTIFQKLAHYDYSSFVILGGKSGTTDQAGYCWATLAEKEEKEYLVVVMGSSKEDGQVEDTIAILSDL